MHTPDPARRTPRLGLPWWGVLALALLAVPRVFVHDLDVSVPGLVMGLLALGPPVAWVAVALWRRVPSPIALLVIVGMVYGVALGIGHVVMLEPDLRDAAARLPDLGGGQGTVTTVFVQAATMVSSILTGALVGLIAGSVAQAIRSVVRARS